MVLRRQMSVVANNIANTNTPAFKGSKMVFIEHLSKAQAGYRAPENGQHHFVRDIGQVRDTSEGPMTRTGNELDLAIAGKGYFVVETDEGTRYTRHGRFQINQDRQIINGKGDVVQSDGGGAITVPVEATDIAVAPDGTVSFGDQVLGKVAVVTFEDEQAMNREPNNLYRTEQNAQPADDVSVAQGMLEQSNVNAIIELTQMIDIHRSHDSVRKVIDDEHDRLRRMVGRLGRPNQNG